MLENILEVFHLISHFYHFTTLACFGQSCVEGLPALSARVENKFQELIIELTTCWSHLIFPWKKADTRRQMLGVFLIWRKKCKILNLIFRQVLSISSWIKLNFKNALEGNFQTLLWVLKLGNISKYQHKYNYSWRRM